MPYTNGKTCADDLIRDLTADIVRMLEKLRQASYDVGYEDGLSDSERSAAV